MPSGFPCSLCPGGHRLQVFAVTFRTPNALQLKKGGVCLNEPGEEGLQSREPEERKGQWDLLLEYGVTFSVRSRLTFSIKKKKKVARNEWVWLCPNIPYLWTLKFRIHIIFICHEIFDFFPTMKKNVKSHRKTGSDLLLVGLTGLQSKLHVCPSRLAPAGSSQS